MVTIRAFIALPLPAETTLAIAAIQKQLVSTGAEVKWEPSDKFHITLKFLGDIDRSLVPQIIEVLEKTIGTLPRFDLTYVGLGGFPTSDRPRVVWIGSSESQQVLHLHSQVELACDSLGFAKEVRPFHAHITLGRLKGNRNLDRLTASLKSITFEPLRAHCSEVHFIRSELRPTGSVYTLLNSIPLAS
jgi:RNA 2',3'-cyclic 3'-phosphodiesterase